MKTLTLVRHGKSSWDDANLADFDRPLASRGLRDAPRMAKRFARKNKKPDVIISSPAERAAHTARIFLEELGLDEQRLVLEPDIYEASWGTLLEIVRGLNDSWSSVVLVGHNPGFTSLASALTENAPANIPTSGIAVIRLPVEQWRMVRDNMNAELDFDYPKNPHPK
ncbi:MAG: histidine phosphatase family protein [Gammaproteobacteria bacterium]|nr:histidine phosphatase family protein [Gammaproteobacteria bacterium]